MAAIEAVDSYRVRNLADLIAVAQIIGYGLAALGSLSLSMDDEMSLSMVLRLRGNANALNRSAEQNRRAIQKFLVPQEPEIAAQQAIPAAIDTHDDEIGDESFLSTAAAELLAAESRSRLAAPKRASVPTPVVHSPLRDVPPPVPVVSEKRHREMWAIAMVKEASEISAGIPGMPPAERSVASIRAGMLTSTANQLLTGGDVPGVAFSMGDLGQPRSRIQSR